MNNELKDGDKVILISKIISIETNRLEIYYGMTQPIIEINFQINSLEIVEKFDEEFDEEFEIKKLEEKILKKEEKNNEIIIDRINVFNSGVNETNQTSKIKSFKDFLNISLEGSYLQRQSYQTKSGLNSFQNKVFNEKKLEEYNTKKKEIENYIGLEFNTICEVIEIREQIIDFKLYYRNKVFFFKDSKYYKNLQKEVFFLKNNSSVEINFKINEIKDPFVGSINIELLSIKKNNKVKLFGKFIKLEFLYLCIYIFLISFTLILFSKINFLGVIPSLIKYIYKN